MKYQIHIRTNLYQAGRNGRYRWRKDANGATALVNTFDTLLDANMTLLGMFNERYSRNYTNWGLARAHNEDCWRIGGMWGFHDDGYTYEVVEVDTDELQRLLIRYSINDVSSREIETFLGVPIRDYLLGDFQAEAEQCEVDEYDTVIDTFTNEILKP